MLFCDYNNFNSPNWTMLEILRRELILKEWLNTILYYQGITIHRTSWTDNPGAVSKECAWLLEVCGVRGLRGSDDPKAPKYVNTYF